MERQQEYRGPLCDDKVGEWGANVQPAALVRHQEEEVEAHQLGEQQNQQEKGPGKIERLDFVCFFDLEN